MGPQICTCLMSSLRDRLPAPHQNGMQDLPGLGTHRPPCPRPRSLPSARSTAQVFVWPGLPLFVMVSIGTASLGRPPPPSQVPSPWPSPSRQLVMF